MALHYILDGYNVIKRLPSLAPLKLELGREELLRLLEEERPQGVNAATVVFDGQPGMGSQSLVGSVRVVFGREGSADETIKRMVEESANRRVLVVVSDDKDIRFYVRALGAMVAGVEEFLGKVRSHQDLDHLSRSRSRENKSITKTVEHKINTELENVWLKKKKKAS